MISNTKHQALNIKPRGFTLIEALTLLFVFSLVTISFYNVISVGTRYIQFSKNRLGAIAVANGKMEIARNLAYDDVGIIGGACSGNIAQDEDISENGKNYHIKTLAAFQDDPFDGTLGGSPNDVAFKDYKILKITVSWNNGGSDQGEVVFVSRFVPPGLEVANDDGILSINIISQQAGGEAVPGATVQIINSSLGFNETRQSDDRGNIMIIGAKEDFFGYQIAVSKSDYETVVSSPPYPDTAYNPVDAHASVLTGELNVINVSSNKLADLKVFTRDYLGNPIGDMEFKLSGGRLLGIMPDIDLTRVYNFNETSNTDLSGEKQFESISPGPFDFSFLESDYEMIGIDMGTSFNLATDSILEINVKVAPKNIAGILVKVMRDLDQTYIGGAEVKLKNVDTFFEEIVTTEIDGMAFFPIDETPLAAGTYKLEISASEMDDFNEEITVAEENIVVKDVLMIEN